ncbi:winged helix-turn-helix transcriptional regulator [Proteobacteria bacterium 005FR1]|nr:winged helix-turn-helix transcriptional regulator [Proteobacteria bacterium 005FR1]
MQKLQLTRIDLHILRELQRDGRITYSALGEKVGLSTSPCMERVKKMERAGIIRGYSAQVDASRLNAGLVVFVEISLERKSHDLFRQFKERAAELEQVQECFLVSGDFDYLIKARVADMDEYRKFLGDTLLSLPGVRESASYVVMEEIKDTQIVSVNRTLSLLTAHVPG